MQEAGLFALLSVLLWIMHRGNIERLLRGSESKIGSELTARDGTLMPPAATCQFRSPTRITFGGYAAAVRGSCGPSRAK